MKRDLQTTPKEYYYGLFWKHLETFLDNDPRARNYPVSKSGDAYYNVYDAPYALNMKNYEVISRYYRDHFIYSLAFVVMIRMVIYRYFNSSFQEFHKATGYPIFEYGLSTKLKPWEIALRGQDHALREKYVNFFVVDMKEFFEKGEVVPEVTWEEFREAMLSDNDVTGDARSIGRLLRDKLHSDV